MRLGLRVFFAFFAITGLAAWLLFKVFLGEIKPSVREAMEDLMVETAHLAAVLVQDDVAAGKPLAGSALEARLREFATREVDLSIWGLRKQSLDLRLYITDAKGQVLLDTSDQVPAGSDFSQWRDVALTLRGDYGARTTASTDGPVMVVAAPLMHGKERIGVLSVAKSQASVQQVIARSEHKVWLAGRTLLLVSLGVGAAVTLWLVFAVRRLRRFAQVAQAGQRTPPPALPGELGDLALAMAEMRNRLEGREHLQHTVRALTHELKSPIAALRASAELLGDELAASDRQRFSAQVLAQSDRLQALVERMLELSKLEAQTLLDQARPLRLDEWLRERLAAHPATWLACEAITLNADAHLLDLLLSNLLGNAADFAPPALECSLQLEAGRAVFSLRDFGPGVAPELLPQLGERFVSTARPGSQVKGSGLGLAIARQIAALHGGSLSFENAAPGLRVRLVLPTSR